MKIEKTIAFSIERIIGLNTPLRVVSRKYIQGDELIWKDQTSNQMCFSNLFSPNLFKNQLKRQDFFKDLSPDELEELINMMQNTIDSLRSLLDRHKQKKASKNCQETVDQKEKTEIINQ